MALNFTQTARHTGTLNHSLVQAIAVMRMSRIELQEHLAAAAESNPFVQPERPRPASGGGGSGDRDLRDVAARTEPSLYQHVGEQIAFAFDTPYCAALAQAFLRELEPSGWLGKSPEHIAAELGVPPGDCMDILYRLQALEPAGLFARDLRECL
ncbi:RNA polymerase factor sigma-54, partial [Puniceibacterium confluentis]|uniref:RNA polymerase factor sigma-54 n=1 Tax=Puniceibacterium confluentis TaxID=1958944 RepID=UPI004035E9F3